MKSIAALVLIALAAAACQNDSNGAAPPEIVIASAFPTSAFGVRLWQQAVEFAVRQQSTIDGYSVVYRPFDDSLGSEQDQLVARRNVRLMIADSSVLGVVGPGSSFETVHELPLANPVPLAMISPSATNVCLTQPPFRCGPTPADLRPSGLTTFFRISPRDPLAGQAMADYAVAHLGVTKVAAFNELGVEGVSYLLELSNELHKQGAELVYQQDLPEGTVKFSDFLSIAKNLGADAVFAFAPGDDNSCVAAQQMSALMPKAIFFGTDGNTSDPACIKQMGTSPPGAWAAVPDVDRIVATDPAVENRAKAFLKAFPQKTLYAYTLAAYDATRILIEAIDLAIRDSHGFPTRSKVVEELATKTFVEATGTYRFDANGDAVAPLMSIYKVQGSHWVFADVYTFGAA
ncbi:MAG TPA: branched-chain amino acid ABC transporter substrate-binding protein [Candidatus Dormibacteraeota bacterium]|nr:branched-chain amino acid ABC transporter substrate-binding protein [Candidatus Dormibacteraeota bacterium]